MTATRLLVRGARLLTVALVVGIGISQLVFTLNDWHLRDMGAYWEAAERLRAGEELYPALADGEASDVYRYAPWFAWLWIPVTYLPREAANVLWSFVLLVASGLALLPLVRLRAWLAIAFFLPILVGISAIGNVQPLLVAALVLGVERRTGPLWIAAAASLKAVPILLVATFVGRGEWSRAFVTVALTAALVAPAFLYDLSSYPSQAGEAAALLEWPVAYAAAVGMGMVLSVRLAGTRKAWLMSSATAVAAVPRLFVYDITLLLVGRPAGDSTAPIHPSPSDRQMA